jgi:hypothetical protein
MHDENSVANVTATINERREQLRSNAGIFMVFPHGLEQYLLQKSGAYKNVHDTPAQSAEQGVSGKSGSPGCHHELQPAFILAVQQVF